MTNNDKYVFKFQTNRQVPVKKPLSKRAGEEVKTSFSGLSLSPCAYCLVNRLTCCQRSLCECALAEGQSDPPACLSQRGKWRPWYAISGRNVQTVWLLRQAWLAVALPELCRRNYLLGTRPGGLVLQGPVVIYLFIHLNLMHTDTFKKHFSSLTSTSTGSDNTLLWAAQVRVSNNQLHDEWIPLSKQSRLENMHVMLV